MREMKARRLVSWAVILVGAVLVARSVHLLERLTAWREIDSVWSHQPPVSSASFWQFTDAVVTRPSDDRLVKAVERLLGSRFNARSIRQYHALPLLDYLRLRGA